MPDVRPSDWDVVERGLREASYASTEDALAALERLKAENEALREEVRYAGLHTQQPVDLNYIALLKDDWERIVALSVVRP